jgi:hypothetical protein
MGARTRAQQQPPAAAARSPWHVVSFHAQEVALVPFHVCEHTPQHSTSGRRVNADALAQARGEQGVRAWRATVAAARAHTLAPATHPRPALLGGGSQGSRRPGEHGACVWRRGMVSHYLRAHTHTHAATHDHFCQHAAAAHTCLIYAAVDLACSIASHQAPPEADGHLLQGCCVRGLAAAQAGAVRGQQQPGHQSGTTRTLSQPRHCQTNLHATRSTSQGVNQVLTRVGAGR